MSETLTVKVPDGTTAKLRSISPNVSRLLRTQIDNLIRRKVSGSAHEKAADLCGSIPMPAGAATSDDYLKQYGPQDAD
jgi:hypothetical protein